MPNHAPHRRRLPDNRNGLTAKRTSGNIEFYVTVNFYPDSADPGEVFLVLAKTGSELGGFADLWSMTISLALQHGVQWPALADKFRYTRFGTYSTTEDPSIGHAVAVAVDEIIEARRRMLPPPPPAAAPEPPSTPPEPPAPVPAPITPDNPPQPISVGARAEYHPAD